MNFTFHIIRYFFILQIPLLEQMMIGSVAITILEFFSGQREVKDERFTQKNFAHSFHLSQSNNSHLQDLALTSQGFWE